MQISGVTTSQVIPLLKATTPQAGGTASDNSDRAELNLSANSFSSLVHDANQMPDVRSEVVDSFKSRIQAGHYPAQDVIAGLTRLIGGGIMQTIKEAQGKASDSASS